MKINRENYEEYFLDYSEGNLDPTLYNDLLDFLNNNPDLKKELRIFQDSDLIFPSTENVIFHDKDSLKKDIASDIANTIIASLEGDLSSSEQKEFLKKLEDDLELKNEYLQFKKTKIKPSLSIKFQGKHSLKRTLLFGLKRKTFVSFLSAAASVIIILSVSFFASTLFNSEERLYSERKADIIESNELADNILPADIVSDKGKITEPVKPDPDKKEVSKKKNTAKDNVPEQKVIQRKLSIDSIRKSDVNIPQERDTLNLNLKKIDPNSGKLPGDTKKKAAKPIIKPVEIQSQGLLADASFQKNDKEFLSVKDYLGKSFKERVLNEKSVDSYSLNAWDLADAGLKGINKIAGTEMGISRKVDDKGDVVAYSFVSNKLSIEKGNIKGQ